MMFHVQLYFDDRHSGEKHIQTWRIDGGVGHELWFYLHVTGSWYLWALHCLVLPASAMGGKFRSMSLEDTPISFPGSVRSGKVVPMYTKLLLSSCSKLE